MNQAFQVVAVAAGWVLVLFIGLLCATFLYKIWYGPIDLKKIISETNGDASLSRLQFLIFTVVISMSLFFVVMRTNPPGFPTIPDGVMMLLGISGSSYLVSKGIQFSNPAGLSSNAALQLSATPPTVIAASATVQLTVSLPASASGTPMPTLRWSLDAPSPGTIVSTGPTTATYTAPAPLPQSGTKVTVRAQADGSGFLDGVADIAFSTPGAPAVPAPPALTLTANPSKVTVPPGPVNLTVSLPASAAGTPMPTLRWSLDAPALGTIVPTPNASTATYTAPNPLPAPGTKVSVRAQADGSGFADGVADITF